MLANGLVAVTSPGRLQVLATEPSVIVDAAHNPHGARALAATLLGSFAFDSITAIVGVLDDKDARGIIEALDPVVTRFVVTRSDSERALDVDVLAEIATAVAGPDRVRIEPELAVALAEARDEAGPGDAVLVTGSITLVGQAMLMSAQEDGES